MNKLGFFARFFKGAFSAIVPAALAIGASRAKIQIDQQKHLTPDEKALSDAAIDAAAEHISNAIKEGLNQ